MFKRFNAPVFIALLALLTHGPSSFGQSIPGFFEPATSDAQFPFYHGVASGDATSEAVVLWTRLSFSNEQVPFVAFGEVDVATDTAFSDVVLSLPVQGNNFRDWCVKADVSGLEPDTWYYYRFRIDVNTLEGPEQRTSITGRTKTLPAPGMLPQCGQWRAAAVSCLNFQSGHFNALGALAERNDLDAVLALGDQIYEYYSPGGEAVNYQRYQWPQNECFQEFEYSQRWLTQRLDPDMQAASQQYPWYVSWDDHEVANEAYGDGAQYHNEAIHGPYANRKAAALKAFYDWNPIRETAFTSSPDVIETDSLHCYRAFDVGSLVKLVMLDTRTFRSQWVSLSPDILAVALDPTLFEDSTVMAELGPALLSLADTSRTMLGPEQKDWLESMLTPQQMGVWNLFAQQVMFSPIPLADLSDAGLPSYPLSNPGNGIVDKWDGYQADRQWLADRFAPLSNPVVLTGDIHQEFALEVPDLAGGFVDAAGAQAGSLATEFTATSVVNGPRIWPLTEAAAQQIIPWLEHGDIDNPLSKGYTVLDFNLDRLHVDFVQVESQWARNTSQFLSTAFEVPADAQVPEGEPLRFLQELSLPLDASMSCAPAQPLTMEQWLGWNAPGWGHPGTPDGIGELIPDGQPHGAASGSAEIRLWIDASGQLQSDADLAEVRWFDGRGRRLAAPVGPGPWLVFARAKDGRTTRRWLRWRMR